LLLKHILQQGFKVSTRDKYYSSFTVRQRAQV